MILPIDDYLALELLDRRHAAPLLALVQANRPHLRAWLPWVDQMQTEEQFGFFITSSKKRHEQKCEFPLVINAGGQLAGRIGVYYIDSYNRIGSIGYWLGEAFQGRGIITRACRTLIPYAFDELGLNRLEIKCGTGNTRSQGIPERLGFTKEGVIRQGERLYERFIDLYLYSMLKEEWARSETGRQKSARRR
jgi:ribosomal-protein-serine acetyltransferase